MLTPSTNQPPMTLLFQNSITEYQQKLAKFNRLSAHLNPSFVAVFKPNPSNIVLGNIGRSSSCKIKSDDPPSLPPKKKIESIESPSGNTYDYPSNNRPISGKSVNGIEPPTLRQLAKKNSAPDIMFSSSPSNSILPHMLRGEDPPPRPPKKSTETSGASLEEVINVPNVQTEMLVQNSNSQSYSSQELHGLVENTVVTCDTGPATTCHEELYENISIPKMHVPNKSDVKNGPKNKITEVVLPSEIEPKTRGEDQVDELVQLKHDKIMSKVENIETEINESVKTNDTGSKEISGKSTGNEFEEEFRGQSSKHTNNEVEAEIQIESINHKNDEIEAKNQLESTKSSHNDVKERWYGQSESYAHEIEAHSQSKWTNSSDCKNESRQDTSKSSEATAEAKSKMESAKCILNGATKCNETESSKCNTNGVETSQIEYELLKNVVLEDSNEDYAKFAENVFTKLRTDETVAEGNQESQKATENLVDAVINRKSTQWTENHVEAKIVNESTLLTETECTLESAVPMAQNTASIEPETDESKFPENDEPGVSQFSPTLSNKSVDIDNLDALSELSDESPVSVSDVKESETLESCVQTIDEHVYQNLKYATFNYLLTEWETVQEEQCEMFYDFSTEFSTPSLPTAYIMESTPNEQSYKAKPVSFEHSGVDEAQKYVGSNTSASECTHGKLSQSPAVHTLPGLL